jgi:hypothetical protein
MPRIAIDAMGAFAAVYESESGTTRTWRDVRVESVMRSKADIDLAPRLKGT